MTKKKLFTTIQYKSILFLIPFLVTFYNCAGNFNRGMKIEKFQKLIENNKIKKGDNIWVNNQKVIYLGHDSKTSKMQFIIKGQKNKQEIDLKNYNATIIKNQDDINAKLVIKKNVNENNKDIDSKEDENPIQILDKLITTFQIKKKQIKKSKRQKLFHRHIQLNARVDSRDLEDARIREEYIIDIIKKINPDTICIQEGLNEKEYIKKFRSALEKDYIILIDPHYSNRKNKDGTQLCFIANLFKRSIFDEKSVEHSTYKDSKTDVIQTTQAKRKDGLKISILNAHAYTKTDLRKYFCDTAISNALKNIKNQDSDFTIVGGDVNAFNDVEEKIDDTLFNREYYLNKILEATKSNNSQMNIFSIPSEELQFFTSKKKVNGLFNILRGDTKERIIRQKLDLLNKDRKINKIEIKTLSKIKDLMKKWILSYKLEGGFDIKSRINRIKSKIDLKKLSHDIKTDKELKNSEIFIKVIDDIITNNKIDLNNDNSEKVLVIIDQIHNLLCMKHDPAPIDVTVVGSKLPLKVKGYIKREYNFIPSDKYFSKYKDEKIIKKIMKEHAFYPTLMSGDYEDPEIAPGPNEYPLSDHFLMIYDFYKN